MDDAERDHLLNRLAESERARRRWKVLALASPVLAILLGLALANVITTSLTLREVVEREREERQRALQAEQEARRQLYVAKLRAAQALRAEDAAAKQQP